jgi:hypothetical protein
MSRQLLFGCDLKRECTLDATVGIGANSIVCYVDSSVPDDASATSDAPPGDTTAARITGSRAASTVAATEQAKAIA